MTGLPDFPIVKTPPPVQKTSSSAERVKNTDLDPRRRRILRELRGLGCGGWKEERRREGRGEGGKEGGRKKGRGRKKEGGGRKEGGGQKGRVGQHPPDVTTRVALQTCP